MVLTAEDLGDHYGDVAVMMPLVRWGESDSRIKAYRDVFVCSII